MAKIKAFGFEWEACWKEKPETHEYLQEVKGDASISSCGEGYAYEITSKPLQSLTEAKQLIEFLKGFWHCRGENTGFHIHISFEKQYCYFYAFSYAVLQEFLNKIKQKFTEVERRFSNRYCRVQDQSYFYSTSVSRYHAINYLPAFQKHKTFEVRIFPSEAPEKIYQYLKFTVKFFNKIKTYDIEENEEVEEKEEIIDLSDVIFIP